MSVRAMLMGAGGASELPIQYIAAASAQTSGSASTLTINKPTGVQSGDLLIAIMGADAGRTFTDANFTEVADIGTSPALRVAYRVAGGSEPATYDFTPNSSAKLSGCILAYRYAAYDAIGSFATGANPLVITGPSASVANCRLIGAALRSSTSITITSPGSMTDRVTDNDANAPSYLVSDEVLTSSGATGTRSFGMGSSSSTVGILLTIKPT